MSAGRGGGMGTCVCGVAVAVPLTGVGQELARREMGRERRGRWRMTEAALEAVTTGRDEGRRRPGRKTPPGRGKRFSKRGKRDLMIFAEIGKNLKIKQKLQKLLKF